MSKFRIDRETKIVLLNALKNGYFEASDLENLIIHLYSGLPKEELNEWISVLAKKLDVLEPIIVEVIDRREQVEETENVLY